MNFNPQYYKGIKLILISRDYRGYRARRFTINDTHWNVWIPCVYLDDDGTIKPRVNIDFVFTQNWRACRYAGIKFDETLFKLPDENLKMPVVSNVDINAVSDNNKTIQKHSEITRIKEACNDLLDI